ncbi:MAG: transglutaminase family protein [Candidatus Nanopelagicales bacterium]|jgi:transglutaminase-like putative cysteine protease|nr:transglutaminase family protein [Candidatus Nanopelagicales bacterium]
MTQRLSVVHTTRLTYQGDVRASFNEARMTPLSTSGQLMLRHDLTVTPVARIQRYTDYWGTAVEAFDVHIPHHTLTVVSTSVVDTVERWRQAPGVSWAEIRSAEVADRWCEFLGTSAVVDGADEDPARAQVLAALRAAPTPKAAIGLAIEAVRDRIAYTPGVTHVHTSAGEAWAEGQGVCQDFSHTTLSLLRAVGIPARYVSGYIHTEDAEVGVPGVGESHAWVEVWNGAWEAHDPTNGRSVAAAHVVVARGRDYRDVSPLTGIYAGPLSQDPEVVVEVTRLAR